MDGILVAAAHGRFVGTNRVALRAGVLKHGVCRIIA
jgi:hypothetical protein